jgi:uncharacterized protein YqgC (DUF456 family)
MHALTLIAAVVLVLLGLIGVVIPALPGTPLVFLGLLLAAWADDYQRVGGMTITVLAILTMISFLADLAAAAAGAKSVDASRPALIGGGIGMVAGLFMGWIGLIAAPFVGAFAGEFYAGRNWKRAGRVATVAWIGYLMGTAAKVALAFTMVGIFLLAYFWRR